MTPVIIDFVSITVYKIKVAVHSVITVIVSDIFVRFTIMKLKYILSTIQYMLSIQLSEYNYYIPVDKMWYCTHSVELKWSSWFSCPVTRRAVFSDHSVWGLWHSNGPVNYWHDILVVGEWNPALGRRCFYAATKLALPYICWQPRCLPWQEW